MHLSYLKIICYKFIEFYHYKRKTSQMYSAFVLQVLLLCRKHDSRTVLSYELILLFVPIYTYYLYQNVPDRNSKKKKK